MKKYASWAGAHPIEARWWIAGIQVSSGILAVWQGVQLWGWIGQIHPYIIYLALLAMGLAIVVYPDRDSPRLKWWSHFARRKTGDFVFAVTAYIMVLQLTVSGCDYLVRTQDAPVGQASFMVHGAQKVEKKGWLRSIKEWKNELKNYLAEERPPITVWQVLLLLLSLALAFYLLIIVAYLSCSISCNGSTALATVVLVAGTAVVIFLFILAVKAIFKKQRMARRVRMMKQ